MRSLTLSFPPWRSHSPRMNSSSLILLNTGLPIGIIGAVMGRWVMGRWTEESFQVMGRGTKGRQSITYQKQQLEMQINNNGSNGIRLRPRLDPFPQPGKAQRDKVKNWYLPSMAHLISVAGSKAIWTTGYLDRVSRQGTFAITVTLWMNWTVEISRNFQVLLENKAKIIWWSSFALPYMQD